MIIFKMMNFLTQKVAELLETQIFCASIKIMTYLRMRYWEDAYIGPGYFGQK